MATEQVVWVHRALGWSRPWWRLGYGTAPSDDWCAWFYEDERIFVTKSDYHTTQTHEIPGFLDMPIEERKRLVETYWRLIK